jgi:hypothetical protein
VRKALHAIEDRGADLVKIVPGAIENPIWSGGVLMERQCPSLCQREIITNTEAGVSAEGRESGSGEVHQAQSPPDLDACQRPSVELLLGDEADAGYMSESLDECTIECPRDI